MSKHFKEGTEPEKQAWEALEVLSKLKFICATPSVDALDIFFESMGWTGAAFFESQKMSDGYLTRVLAARGKLASIERAAVFAPKSCRELFRDQQVIDLTREKSDIRALFDTLNPQTVRTVYGEGISVRRWGGEYFIAISTDPLKAPAQADRREQRHHLQLALMAFLTAWEDRDPPRHAHDLPRGEKEVLIAYANGLTPNEIAELRNTSVRTVRSQLDSVRRRLAAKSNAHSVAIAIANNLLPVASLILSREGVFATGKN